MPPKFIYFDLGNVLLNFSDERCFRQMGAVCGAAAEEIADLFVRRDLKTLVETGQMTNEEFYALFCRETGTSADAAELELASSDIFDVNQTIIPVVAQLEAAGYRLGILSNTCEPHWRFITAQPYGIVPHAFEVLALSYELGAMKPDVKIFQAAADLAGVAPQDIFFTDDIPGHVEGARQAGFDAVQYTTTPALVEELHKRGVRFNY
jgi:HAD superfamily hydrolase (TIGR01509 family)